MVITGLIIHLYERLTILLAYNMQIIMFNSSLSYQVCCESSVATGKHVVSSLLNKVCHAITSGKKSNWIPSASFTHSFSTCDKKLHTCIWLRLSQAIYIAIDENAFDSGYAVALVKLSTWECANQTTDYNIYIFYKNNHTSSTNTCWFSPQSISFCLFFIYHRTVWQNKWSTFPASNISVQQHKRDY